MRLTVLIGLIGVWFLAPSTAGAVRTEFFGIAQQQLDAQDMKGMHNARIHTDRFELGWRLLEPSQGSLDWHRSDQSIGALASHGIQPVPFVWGSPSWVASSPSLPPIDTAAHEQAWQTFLYKAVARYGPGGSYWANGYRQTYGADAEPLPIKAWQIWNEPNLTKRFNPGGTDAGSVQKYARLLALSRDAIKGRDPGAQIVLAGNPAYPPSGNLKAWDFLDALYGIPGAKGDFDVAALHPYASTVGAFRSEIQSFHGAMTSNDDEATPLWLTEFGWGSAPPDGKGINQGLAGQDRLLDGSFKTILANRRAWNVQRMFWFLWRDPAPDSTFAHRCGFCGSAGLLRHDRTAKPAFSTFKSFTAETKPPVASVLSGPGDGSFTQSPTPRFGFASSEAGSTFVCRVDAGSFAPCTSPFTVPKRSDGAHVFSVKAIDAPGNESAVASRSFTVDTHPPKATPPAQSLQLGTQLGSGAVPVRLSWSGSDDRTTPASLKFDLETRTNGGGGWSAWSSAAANTSLRAATRSLTQGAAHQFRVRSRDQAGNTSSLAEAPAFTSTVLQEAAVTYTGSWRTESQANASGGAVKTSSQAGATATFAFAGKNAGVVMPQRSTLGSVRICLDPAAASPSCATVDLSPRSGQGARKIVFARNQLTASVQHHIRITVLSGRADLDALARLG